MSIEPITKQMRALALAHRERGRHGRAKELEAFANKIEEALAPTLSTSPDDEHDTLRIKYPVAPAHATPPVAWGVCPHCRDGVPAWHKCVSIRVPAPDVVPYRHDEPAIAVLVDQADVEADVECFNCTGLFTITGRTVRRDRQWES